MAGRWWLYVRALFWRMLMRIGMYLHTVGWSRPPRPTFSRRIEFGTRRRYIDLYFYCPKAYEDASASKEGGVGLFPVVVNFHGGGFTLGCATDDSYWAKCVVQETGAVFVSVGYRRAPEHPFPAAVDDGVEALLYLAAHASDLHLDTSRVTITGFSAGGNLAVTVPLRLQYRIQNDQGSEFLGPLDSTQNLVNGSANLRILSIFAWYPILDFVDSRDHRRATSIFPAKTLPANLTTLFDESYVPDYEQRASPFASPERASDEILADGLPYHVFLYTCEWDMLLNEGQRFVKRLESLGKKVRAMMVEKVPHAWDKSPNPFRDQNSVNLLYKAACAEMKALFDES
jgi:acetyl esterase/lipase